MSTNQTGYIIRKAMPGDIPGIAGTAAQAWHDTYAHSLPENVRINLLALFYAEDQLKRAIEREGSLFEVVVLGDGNIGGFAQWLYTGPTACELVRIYIAPSHQNRGLGTALLKHGLDCLPENISLVKLAVKSDNPQAKEFYAARGFKYSEESGVLIADFKFHLIWYTKKRGDNGWLV